MIEVVIKPQQEDKTMKKFEYKIIDDLDTDKLNSLGNQGWKMVGCGSTNEGSHHDIYLMREII